MRLYLMRYVFALFCCWSSLALAGITTDPFSTEEMLPLKPALRLGGAVGDPCAETLPKGALGLPDVVNLALCNNPQTRAIWASSRVQAAQVGVSRGSYLPGISASLSGNRNSPGNAQRSIGLSLSYLLYDFGTRAANFENAQQLLAAASASQDATVQSVFLFAVQTFYRAQAAQALLDATRESEHAAKQSFAAAEARYRAGIATPADKLQAQTAYSQSTLTRIGAEGGLKKAQGTLANVIGLDANREVQLAAAVNVQDMNAASPYQRRGGSETRPALPPTQSGKENLKLFEQDIAALIDTAKLRRPDLIAAEAQLKAAEAGADAARGASRPSVTLTASTDQVNSVGVTSRGSSVGISVSVPLFSGYAPTYRIRAAEAQVEVQQAQLDRVRQQVALDVWNAYHDLVTATQSLRTSADLLNSAEQSQRVALGRYQAGVGNILDALNAQSALASARQQRIQSTLDWNIGRAALAQAMGNLDGDLLQTLSPDASGSARP